MAYTTTDADQSGYSAMRVQPPAGRLDGLKAIARYAGVSENTLKKLIKEEGFPVGKVGRQWISSVDVVDKWRFGKIGAAAQTSTNIN